MKLTSLTATLLTLSLACSPVQADWLEASLIAAATADLATTELGISQGAVELNPFLQNRSARIAAKAGSTAVFIVVYRKVKKEHPKGAKAFMITAVSLWTAAAIWNLTQQ